MIQAQGHGRQDWTPILTLSLRPVPINTLVAVLVLATTALSSAQTIVRPPDAPASVKLAAKEIRRYVYLRTGTLLPIVDTGEGIALKVDPSLGAQGYRITPEGVAGGSDVAVLYGAYAVAEKLGVRFEISGDVIPDGRIPFALPQRDETHEPLFDLRGIQPFHDFLEGPDWWNADDYKAYCTQMVKMKMNFIGLHSYPWFKPWGHVPPEPGVWIGLPEDVDERGRVKFSYPASWANTARPGPVANNAWGHLPGKTAKFSAGASRIFDRDDYGAEVMNGLTPWPKSAEQCNVLFNRVGDMFGDAFGFARHFGVKVCIGIETPFWVPDEVRTKLKEQGRNPDDPAVLRELCRGMFERIVRSHPVDYFWVWTPERALDPAKTLADLLMVNEVAKEMKPAVGTATCGWGWLAHQFVAFDKTLPKEMAFSCINGSLGFAPVTPEFGKLQGRARWCIPWMEDDTDMTAPQLFAGRVRKDAIDAKGMGCTGLMGIHWRTRVIAPSLDMLAQSGWTLPSGAGTLSDVIGSEGSVTPRVHPQRSLPVDDFYADWCQAQFGVAVAPQAAQIFSRMDGRLPRPACWALGGQYGQSAGPGMVGDADPRPWQEVAKEYAFVDELAALRPQVKGAGSLDRFDYWLGQFKYLRAMGKLRCSRSVFDQAVDRAEREPAAMEAALKARQQLVADWCAMMTHLLETVSTPGEMGTVANLELHARLSGGYLTNFDARLEKVLGRPLPADCAIPDTYTGKARLIVPTVRSVVNKGEVLRLRIIALAQEPVKSVTVHVRPLGKGEWKALPAAHTARAVYEAKFPAAHEDFEYYITGGEKLLWPATAPQINQTVVVIDR
jgi:hypothetical protein